MDETSFGGSGSPINRVDGHRQGISTIALEQAATLLAAGFSIVEISAGEDRVDVDALPPSAAPDLEPLRFSTMRTSVLLEEGEDLVPVLLDDEGRAAAIARAAAAGVVSIEAGRRL